MSEDTKSDAFTRELKSRIGNAPEPNCVTNTEVLKLIAMLRDRISTVNILQACIESAEQDDIDGAIAALMTEDEMRAAVAAQIAMTFDGVKGGRSVVAAVATLAIALPWAREQALREAAAVADEKYGDYRGNDYDNGSGASGYDEACHQIEVAILALINKRD